jgi:hypothetical protein
MTRPYGARPAPKPQPQTTGRFRDKRYVNPVLSVDLMDRLYESPQWSGTGFMAHDAEDTMPQDVEFHGIFNFDGRTGFGMFRGKVTRIDGTYKGVSMTWVNESGRKLLDTMIAVRATLPPNQGPIMRVAIAYPTVNWSLSGMLIGEVHNPYEEGAHIRGMIRGEHSISAGMFKARVVKVLPDRKEMGFAFTELSDQLFDMLEGAIKRFVQG